MIVPTNRLLFWVAALLPFVALGAMVSFALPLMILLIAALLLAACLDAVLGMARTRGIRILLPEVVRLAVDRPGLIPVRIHSEHMGHLRVRVGLPLPDGIPSDTEAMDVALPGGSAESSVAWPCTPADRGAFTLSRCFFEVPSPFGFWGARGASDCRSELRVYPDLRRERRRLAALLLRRGLFGIHVQRMVGQGRDFEKLREYVPGDSYEDIHWKATAKRGRPITKLYQVERTREIYVLLDTSRLSARESGAEPALDRFITSALLLGLVAEQQGDRFGLLTFSDRVERFIRAGAGRAHYNACRDALFSLRSELTSPDFDELAAFIRLKLRRRALLLILTDLGDPALAESFVRNAELICRRHVVMVSMIRQPGVEPLFSAPNADTTDSLYENLGRHLVWMDLRELGRNLQHKGVRLSLVDDERLSADLVTQYMNMKARQVL